MIAGYDQPQRSVLHLDDDPRFHRRTTDVEWIGTLATDTVKWSVITADARIMTSAPEREAMRQSGLTFFVLTAGWLRFSFHEQAWRLVRLWPEIVARAESGTYKVYEVSGGRATKIRHVRV